VLLNVSVLVYHDVIDHEVSSAMTVFKTALRFLPEPEGTDEPLINVFTAHRTRASVLGSSGLVMTPTYAFSGSPDPDVLVIAGGAGLEKLFKDAPTKDFVTRFAPRAKHVLIGSNAALLLGEYGLLTDRVVSIFPALIDTAWKYNPGGVREARVTTDQNWHSVSHSSGVLEASLQILELELGLECAQSTRAHLGVA
jgi:transcriptional regulator GlxA family with amidase domain